MLLETHEFRMHLAAIERQQDVIIHLLMNIIKMETKQMTTLNDVLAKATELASLEDSVKTVLDGANAHISALEAQLAQAKANQADPARIEEIGAAIDKATVVARAMSAVAANTPSAPAPAEKPVEEVKTEPVSVAAQEVAGRLGE